MPIDEMYIREALQRGETLTVEFKERVLIPPSGLSTGQWRQRDEEADFIRHVGALANMVEGADTPVLIIIGVDNNGVPTPMGAIYDRPIMDRLAREEFERPIALRYTPIQLLTPAGDPVEIVAVEIVADVGERPYRVRANSSTQHRGRAFARRFQPGSNPPRPETYVLDSTDIRRLEEAAQLARLAQHIAVCSDLPLEGLDTELVNMVLGAMGARVDRTETDARRRRMVQAGLLTQDGRPTIVGALLCADLPLPSSLVGATVVAVIHDLSGGPPRVRHFSGRLQEQLRASYDWLLPQMSARAPGRALREILTNALLHRDYRSAEPVRVDVEADRCRITSPGLLISPLELYHLTGPNFYAMQPPHRNPVLVRLFLAAQRH